MAKNKKIKTKYKKVNTPTVLQMEALECGAASLAMILGFYKKFIPLEQLRIDCGVSRDGSKASNVLKAARKYGLTSSGYRKEINSLYEMEFPAIIFWNFNHFVVLEGIKNDKFYINDPASGKKVVNFEDFDNSFTGVVLTFKPNEEFQKSGKKSSIIPSLKSRAKGNLNILIYIILLGLFLLIPGFVIPSFSKFFIDEILVKNMTGFLKPLLIAMGLTVIIEVILTWLQQTFLLKLETKLAVSSSAKFIMHLFKLSPNFFSQRMPGDLSERIAENDNVSIFISEKLTTGFINLVCTLFYITLMLIYDVPLTVLCIVLNITGFLFLILFKEKIKTKTAKVSMESSKFLGSVMSGLQMIETIKASGLENDFFLKCIGQQAKVVIEKQEMQKFSIINAFPQTFSVKVLDVLLLSIGALRIIHGDLTIGMFVAFQGLSSCLSGPIQEFIGLINEIQSCAASMQRIDDVMNYPLEQRFLEETENKFCEKLNGYISLKNVSFGYSRLDPPLIEDFNLELKPGSRVALVGSSGSGKSTIGKLISSLYEPWSGEVLFDGKPINKIQKNIFSSSVSVVDQDVFIFEGSIKDNLVMWDNSIPEEVYIQAAKDACIHDDISNRQGDYNSFVEEGGLNFSGGQRQRFEIARALATNPRIIILDEATSALDPVTELKIDNAVRRRGCTCVIIAHRLSTIRDCDEIIVMDRGKIVQRGKHEDLIKQEGTYQQLVKTM